MWAAVVSFVDLAMIAAFHVLNSLGKSFGASMESVWYKLAEGILTIWNGAHWPTREVLARMLWPTAKEAHSWDPPAVEFIAYYVGCTLQTFALVFVLLFLMFLVKIRGKRSEHRNS